MSGDFATITSVLTRTPKSDPRDATGATLPAGKAAAPIGQSLPAAAPPPVVDVAKAVERLNELMASHERSLRFQIDASSGRTVITVINEATNEVVRQIPSPELLQIAHNLDEIGRLIDAHV
jgi:flagellar protein FlaG